jgi:isochorismate synthase EntC
VHVLDLVRALHPTPAVCGTPRDAAIRWIASHEPETRGWYAGAVGWFDAAGDGAFSVAIRSGVLTRQEAWLYAGAGIVEGSDPALEYAEARVKQAPMLTALGFLP